MSPLTGELGTEAPVVKCRKMPSLVLSAADAKPAALSVTDSICAFAPVEDSISIEVAVRAPIDKSVAVAAVFVDCSETSTNAELVTDDGPGVYPVASRIST